MTIMEALQWANERLKKTSTGFDSPMLDAQVLLAHVLSVSKSWLFTHLDEVLQSEQEERFQKYIERRAHQEPVAYITGVKEFYKRVFEVNRFVLIPRPATEILIDEALTIARKQEDPNTVLFTDIGTGSGAIALTLAAESGLPVIAIDISEPALAIAQKNAENLQLDSLIDFRLGDLLDPLVNLFEKMEIAQNIPPYEQLIVCANLPYLTESQWENAQKEIRNFEPKLACVGGHDGLDLYWRLFQDIQKHRHIFPKDVTILIEIDPSQKVRIQRVIQHNFPTSIPRTLQDLEGFNRVMIVDV